MKYEYKVSNTTFSDLALMLNALAESGWEPISFDYNGYKVAVVLKREKKDG